MLVTKHSVQQFFDLMGISPAYTLDMPCMHERFSILEESLHPDLFPQGTSEHDYAQQTLAMLRCVYACVCDDIKRAQILFVLKDVEIPGQNGSVIKQDDLMMDIMALEDTRAEMMKLNQLTEFTDSLRNDMEILQDDFNCAFFASDVIRMTQLYVRLSFYARIYRDTCAQHNILFSK